MNKLHQYKSKAVVENKDNQILWNFEIQTDHPIQTSVIYLVSVKKRKKCLPNYKIHSFVSRTQGMGKNDKKYKTNRTSLHL